MFSSVRNVPKFLSKCNIFVAPSVSVSLVQPTLYPIFRHFSSSESKSNPSISSLSESIEKSNSLSSLKEAASQVFRCGVGVPSVLVSQLMKKAGDLNSTDLVFSYYLQYYSLVGYTDITTAEIIDQFSRYGYLEGIAQVYTHLSRKHVKMTANSYKKFLTALLVVPKYKQVCMNITKEMLLHNYLLPKNLFFKSIKLDGVSDSDILISLLSITDSQSIELPQIIKTLEKKMKQFSSSRREVSVWELYKYICILSPSQDHRHLTPFLTQSIAYFLERNLAIEIDKDDEVMNRSYIRAELQSRFNSSERLEAYVDVIAKVSDYRDIRICEFFKHFAKLADQHVDASTWQKIRELGIHVNELELHSAGKVLMRSRNKEMISGFIECFGSKISTQERNQFDRILSSLPQQEDTQQPASEYSDSLSLSDKICACYQRVIRSNSPDSSNELRSMIAGLSSAEEVEKVLRLCVSGDNIISQLEVKQFVLALLDANRVEEAKQLAVLLQREFKISNPRLIKEFLSRGISLPLSYSLLSKQTHHSFLLYNSIKYCDTQFRLYSINPILSKFSSRITQTKAIFRIE